MSHLSINEFIKSEFVLTLCVQMPDNQLWACNAFYVFNEALMELYFLSDLNTKHGKAMLANPNVAGTISHSSLSIKDIQGIQFQADAILLSNEEAKFAYESYYKVFPFAHLMKSSVWALYLSEIKMTNNRVGFANKSYWSRFKPNN